MKPIYEVEVHGLQGPKRTTLEEVGMEVKEKEECKERERGTWFCRLFPSSWDKVHLFLLDRNLAIPLIAMTLSLSLFSSLLVHL